MDLSLDFGGSTVDMVTWNFFRKRRQILKTYSFERSDIFDRRSENLAHFFQKISSRIDFDPRSFEKIFVTGGKSRFFSDYFERIPVVKIGEIEAIGKGGHFLLYHDPRLRPYHDQKNILVVSMGTGTCMVKLQQKDRNFAKSQHVGGTGVGGGTFLGLARTLLRQTDLSTLKELFQSGQKHKVDLSVQEIVGSGIGLVPGKATASNLAKLASLRRDIDFSDADLAAGIANLIGQTIGLLAVFAAKAHRCEIILLTGKLTSMQKIVDTIFDIGKIYQVPMVVPKDAASVSALGAWR